MENKQLIIIIGAILILGLIFSQLENKNIKIDSLELLDPVYEDLRFPVSAIRLQGLNPPEQVSDGLLFKTNKLEYAYIIAQTPHNRKDNSNLNPHFHWQTTTNETGSVVWALDYSCASVNKEFLSYNTLKVVSESKENNNLHMMTNTLTLPGDGLLESAICKITLYRDINDIRDTYPSEAKLIEFDIHYLIDKLGGTR